MEIFLPSLNAKQHESKTGGGSEKWRETESQTIKR
jgi:hypothetical protein